MSYITMFESNPVWVSVIAGIVLLGIVKHWLTQERPYAAYPVIAVDGKSPKQSWMQNGPETLAKGLRQVLTFPTLAFLTPSLRTI